MSEHHNINVYIDEGEGLAVKLVCYEHDEYDCGWQDMLEELGAIEFMSRYTGKQVWLGRINPVFTATDEYDMSWDIEN